MTATILPFPQQTRQIAQYKPVRLTDGEIAIALAMACDSLVMDHADHDDCAPSEMNPE